MRFTLICLFPSVLGIAQSLPSIFERDFETTTEEWKMSIPNTAYYYPDGADSPESRVLKDPVWVAAREVEAMPDEETLFSWANKGFNYVKRQENCLNNKSLLVSVFYDDFKKKIYASTQPRGLFESRMRTMREGGVSQDIAPVWRRWKRQQPAKGAKAMHAEDGAYWFAESIDPFSTENPDLPPYGNPSNRLGSKIATWGVGSSNADEIVSEPGEPKGLCDLCRSLAEDLGVYPAWPTGEKSPVTHAKPPKQGPPPLPRPGSDSFEDDDYLDMLDDRLLEKPSTEP